MCSSSKNRFFIEIKKAPDGAFFNVVILPLLQQVEHLEEQNPLLVQAWSNRMPNGVREVSFRASYRACAQQALSTQGCWISRGFEPLSCRKKYC